MLTRDAMRETIDQVLASKLGDGFERSEIRAGEDNDGDRALYIKAFFRPNSRMPSSRASLQAMAQLRLRLLDEGEERLPYLDLDYPADADVARYEPE